MVDKISSQDENDYTPVNRYIDEQSKLRKAKSFWITARSWALILVAIGLLAVLLAWAYSLLNKNYVLQRTVGIQERIIERKVNEAITEGNFSKNSENLENLNNNISLTESNEQLQKEIDDLKKNISREESAKDSIKQELQTKFGDKVEKLESEKVANLKKISELKEKLKNNPENVELLKKIDDLKSKGEGIGDLYWVLIESAKINDYNLGVHTRFKFDDPNDKPKRVSCYIHFNDPSIANLELRAKNEDFKMNIFVRNKGFTKKDFVKIKNKYCKWDYFK